MREPKKIKTGISGMAIVALVFGIIGIVYLPIGLGLGLSSIEGSGIFLAVFGSLGLLFLLTAIILLILCKRKRSAIQAAYDYGEELRCQITDIQDDYQVKVNRRPYCRAICQWKDPANGTVHVFRSRRMKYLPEELIGQTVSVYLDPYNEKAYYVDLDPVLPDIKLH